MPLFQAVALGLVQGLTEFIPISSSGHLVIVPSLFGWDEQGLAFDVLLHFGSLIALIVYFWGDLMDIARGAWAGDASSRKMILLLAVGTVPAGVAGLALAETFEQQFEDAPGAALQLLLTAAILVAAELVLRARSHKAAREGTDLRRMTSLRTWEAGLIGVAQAIAIVPGISRSGSTIASGLALGLRRQDAARFAFLLAIPALLGAAIVQIPDLAGEGLGWGPAIGGFLASLVASYLAIAGLLRFLRNNTLYPFALYCLIAGPVFYLLLR